MKNLDITGLSKAECRADDWRGVSFALFMAVSFLSVTAIIETRCGAVYIPLAFIAIAWLNMRLAFSKHLHAIDMLAVAQQLAALNDEEEEEAAGMCFSTFVNNTGRDILAGTPVYVIPPAPKMKPPKVDIPVGTGKSGVMQKILEDEGYTIVFSSDGLVGYAKPQKCECVSAEFQLFIIGEEPSCPKCGKPVRCHVGGV